MLRSEMPVSEGNSLGILSRDVLCCRSVHAHRQATLRRSVGTAPAVSTEGVLETDERGSLTFPPVGPKALPSFILSRVPIVTILSLSAQFGDKLPGRPLQG